MVEVIRVSAAVSYEDLHRLADKWKQEWERFKEEHRLVAICFEALAKEHGGLDALFEKLARKILFNFRTELYIPLECKTWKMFGYGVFIKFCKNGRIKHSKIILLSLDIYDVFNVCENREGVSE